ncbi:DMT family transporter [Akkermansiaceae bacterium]|jgi:drug/metabolite transporter (DMT)-like permease|nr:DMT family transporter [Akkermansiaceae bacterium]MDA7610297.1 DMT family transporter [bacterium]MDA7522326.1 DMT family transporter [Akkermansiaceae bacterium]MDA7539517.1 DMT family transporter [Akkermansiaceae bacterium]MDA7612210.1 DMT family transporter [bacterium]
MSFGDICAVASALFWSVAVILMRVSGLKVPPLPLTFFKIWVAVLLLMGTLLWEGSPWVLGLTSQDYLRLVVSAVLGITLADTMIASALNRLGASLQALADCVYSPVIALVGLVMFGEHLSAWEMVGGALVVSGVFVGATRTVEIKKPNDLWIGILLAAGAHIIMAVGILMVRDLFREHSLVWVSTFRFVVAGVVMLFWGALGGRKKLRHLFLGFRTRETWKFMIPMSILGPFLATLFWVAGFKHLNAGRAAIFNQLSTVFIVILAYLILKEKFTARKIAGVLLAIFGSLVVAMH